MLNPSFSDLLKNGESKYTLVMVAAKRARQIIDGSKPLVETSSSKPVTIALEELIEGKIEYETPNTNSIK
ncbi:DNA-directed RNA polymerase subunit omega [Paratissierella segnis]|jgi:DNA-directed RNA polymerase subunit omega|uniref:DNA-directed RNA polymerase subunit omega n=1 Tax=Paratissierella segnis TaxID=2763679 RepID=A0A926EUR5_9FIRM|nr:DNA-directed RNA polymerase subunit omega [Paratissierella segnis]MBC8588638.1 DNA-directed RNA polymerase subunit omega [Paratissierella segnis]